MAPDPIPINTFGEGLVNAYPMDPGTGTTSRGGVNVEIDHPFLREHPAAILLGRKEALDLAARIEEAAEQLPWEPFPSLWVGDLRHIPFGAAPPSFWHGWVVEPNDGPFIAVVFDDELYAVVEEENHRLLWHVHGTDDTRNDSALANLIVASGDLSLELR